MQIDYPLHIDGRGRLAETKAEDHLRDLIEQVLFTTPGERVNRPTFGSGLLQLVFEPNSAALASATQLTVQGALQQWLGELILVEAVQVESVESTVRVTVQYLVRQTQQRQVAQFQRSV
ncbi:MAG TPA: GPW/gp25 family protein [Anaerolineae bacterium]|nr:GPW/gp25 family protein [Anaerolineae bacterium]HMR66243.1 GPW/gp25 family protein [Anaerolineae bacterium]